MQPRLIKGDGFVHIPDYGHIPDYRDAVNGQPPNEATNPANMSSPALFLDRDGVLIREVGFIDDPKDLDILPAVTEALTTLQKQFLLVVVTNQSGIARGFLSEDDLFLVHQELVRRLYEERIRLNALYYCPHYPEAPVDSFGGTCGCRKPKPGMLIHAAEDWNIDLTGSYMVGDRPSDMEAAVAAGVKGFFMGGAVGDAPSLLPPNVTPVQDLLKVSRHILSDASVSKAFPGLESLPAKSSVPSELSTGVN